MTNVYVTCNVTSVFPGLEPKFWPLWPIILISFMISLRWRVTRLRVCPGPGPPGLARVQECVQVFQVTTTTLWCRRRGNELISGVITFIKTEDRLWHFISETGPLCPNTDKTWFINPAPPSGICPCYHPSSPELAVAPCLMFSQLIVPGLASQSSLSRPLTTSSVSWHHDRWTERQQPANIEWSVLLIMVVSEEERLTWSSPLVSGEVLSISYNMWWPPDH